MRHVVLTFALLLSSTAMASSQALPRTVKMIQLNLSPAMYGDLDLKMAVDLSQSPMKMKAQFKSYDDDGDIKAKCEFTKKLTLAESKKVKSLLNNLRYCQKQGPDDMIEDPEYMESLLAYNQVSTSGRSLGAELQKYFLAGWGEQKYICSGGKEFYRYMKSLTASKVSGSCPKNYSRLFSYNP